MLVSEFKSLITSLWDKRDPFGRVKVDRGFLHIYGTGSQVNFNDSSKNALNNIILDDEGIKIMPCVQGKTQYDRARYYDNDSVCKEIGRFMKGQV